MVKTGKPVVDPPGWSEFWDGVPKKIAKAAALKSYRKAIRRASPETILAGLPGYHASEKNRQRRDPAGFQHLHPHRWLDQDRWEDDVDGVRQPKSADPAATARDTQWKTEIDRIEARRIAELEAEIHAGEEVGS